MHLLIEIMVKMFGKTKMKRCGYVTAMLSYQITIYTKSMLPNFF